MFSKNLQKLKVIQNIPFKTPQPKTQDQEKHQTIMTKGNKHIKVTQRLKQEYVKRSSSPLSYGSVLFIYSYYYLTCL